MRIESVGKQQSFGINPSNNVRNCMVKAAMDGKNINTMIKEMKEIYPYKYMTMLGDYNNVQAIGITDFVGSVPRIGKRLPEEFIPEYNKYMFESTVHAMGGKSMVGKCVTPEGQQFFAEHAVTDVLKPEGDNDYIMLFSDKEGKPFIEIIDNIIVTKLQEIKESFTPNQKIANKIEQQFPKYSKP